MCVPCFHSFMRLRSDTLSILSEVTNYEGGRFRTANLENVRSTGTC